MHVLIYEPRHTGHRLTTVRVLLDALLELDASGQIITRITLATTTESLESEEFATQLANVSDRFETTLLPEIPSGMSMLREARDHASNLRSLLHHQEVDHLYIPYADTLLQYLTLSRFFPGNSWWPSKPTCEVLLMKSSYAYPFARASRRMLSLLAVKFSGCDRVHLNDPLAWEFLSRKHPGTLNKVSLMPDPISDTISYSKTEARQKLGLPVDARIAGCVGLINKRKGANVAIESFSKAGLESNDYLLLAGRLSPDIRLQVDKLNDSRIICMDRYVSEDELSLALSAMDLVVTPYPQVVGSASVIIRAAVAERMVLSNDSGWPGYIVDEFELGATCPISDISTFSRRLHELLAVAASYKPSTKARNFVLFNTTANVRAHWVDLIRHRLGLNTNPELRRWQ